MATETISEVAFKKGEKVRYKGHMCYESIVSEVGDNGLITIGTRYNSNGKTNYMSVSPDQLVKSPFKIKSKVKYKYEPWNIATVEEYRKDGKVKIKCGKGSRLVVAVSELVNI